MIIDCISDLRDGYPKLECGDLLIIAGDLTEKDTDKEHLHFIEWLAEMQAFVNKYKKIIYIAGNHDNFLDPKNNRYGQVKVPLNWNIEYLCDSKTEFEGLKIWGSPWTKSFPSMNPNCNAFTVDDEHQLAEIWDAIPLDTDILITHMPPFDILDEIDTGEKVGSMSLFREVLRIRPKLHVFGHIHECGGKMIKGFYQDNRDVIFVNASQVNKYYKRVNKPVRIEL